jgi:hypothetical protein
MPRWHRPRRRSDQYFTVAGLAHAKSAERLAWLGSHQIVTPVTLKNGIGAYDRDRLAQNVAQVGKAFGLTRIPELAEIYDDRFLPPREERLPLN